MKIKPICATIAGILCVASACAGDNGVRHPLVAGNRNAALMREAHSRFGVGMMHMIDARRLDFERSSTQAAEKWALAAEAFEMAAQADPGGVEIFRALIECYARLGRAADALNALDRLAQAIPDTPEARREMAQTFKNLNMERQAVEQYRKALDVAPVGSRIWRDIALEFAAQRKAAGRPGEAEVLLRQVLDADPEDGAARLELAYIAGERDDHREAIQLIEPMLTADEPMLDQRELTTAVFFLANEYEKAGMLNEGIEAFEKLIDSHPDDHSVRQAAMLMMDSAGRLERASEIGEEFLARHPDSHSVLLILAAVLEKRGEFENALALYRKALDAGMPFTSITVRQMLSIAESLDDAGEAEKALEIFLEALATDALSDEIRARAASSAAALLWRESRLDEAVEMLKPYAEYPRADWRQVVLYAHFLRDMDELGKAEDLLMSALRRSAGQPLAMMQLHYSIGGLFLLDPEAEEDAEKHLRAALTIQPDHAASANALAYMFALRERYLDEAENLVIIALDQFPDEPAYLDTLGWVKYKKALRDDSLDYLRSAIELLDRAAGMEEDNVLFDHLGDALFVAGELERAAENWRRALDIDDRPGMEQIDREFTQFKIETAEAALADEAREHGEALGAERRIVRPLARPPSKPPDPN